jgi:GH24 family phage-related lysozyme (muramidase)
MANTEKSLQIASDFIKTQEGLYSLTKGGYAKGGLDTPSNTPIYAYYDKLGGIWTIGWGTTRTPDGKKFDGNYVITKAQADARIYEEAAKWEKFLSTRIPKDRMTDNEYAVMISLSYNAGGGNFMKSRIPSALNRNAPPEEVANIIRDSMVTAAKSGGQKVKGLVNRRAREAQLYLTPSLGGGSSQNKGKNVALYVGIAVVSVGISLYLYNKLS